jgi:hypothetical protein
MTVGIAISDKQGNILIGRKNIHLLGIMHHHKNRVFSNLRLTSFPIPEGEYDITHTVTDVPYGKSFKIVKDMAISG